MSQGKASYINYKEVPTLVSSNSSTPSERKYENAPIPTSPLHSGGMHIPKYQSTLWRPAYLLILITVVVPIPFLVWSSVKRHSGMLGASVIGGQLTYTQAKAIDFICGAVLAPILMVSLDYLWFSNARVSVVNERHAKDGVSLTTLITASTTSSGGFDPIRLMGLLRGGTGRLCLLALLVLLSGMANKMLANFIAYQAFDVHVPDGQPTTLRMMTFTYFDPTSINATMEELTDFPDAQASNLGQQWTSLITSLNFQNAVSKLDDGNAYIAANATTASFDAVAPDIVGLKDVPGYRLSVDCQPGQPNGFAGSQNDDDYDVKAYYELVVMFACNETQGNLTCADNYYADIPGHVNIGADDAIMDQVEYVGFLHNNTYAYLGILMTTNVSDWSYGEVNGTAFNMSTSGFEGSRAVVTTWGVGCKIMRQEGFLNYTRQKGQSWAISESSFLDQKTIMPASLATYQTPFPYTAPASSIGGFAPAIARSAYYTDDDGSLDMNWTVYALNYLYASGQTQRMSYEVGAQNTSYESHFYNVTATTTVQHYRITYIPLLLILGLTAIICAALITAAIALYTKDAHSSRTDRDVNTLRLLVDSVAGLQSSASYMADAGNLSQKELERWADKYRVGYTQVVEGGDIIIRLHHHPGNSISSG